MLNGANCTVLSQRQDQEVPCSPRLSLQGTDYFDPFFAVPILTETSELSLKLQMLQFRKLGAAGEFGPLFLHFQFYP